ncbi:Electron transfer flavoprotein subunit alpha N-terminal domain-containing protein [Desulfonema limicola]|uniref:Electron transfer flavoprotein subunit alpha N-terminal domain-containing protein n=1 Tax=Desulfonema limicola TaxID=45656 RepID=A0A975B9G2_9BACT|nr:electron transfer flavoprotein subunit alpha/FixB family protein [Desulfonema limicola]QTA81454.1 Electron transfer flavoprotein subunit alpha N-terminal domain-containing protein [Desulfonema limicola]
MFDIWILVQQREGSIEAPTFGLTAEARRLVSELGGKGIVTAVALGSVSLEELASLGSYGVKRVLNINTDQINRCQGEYFSQALFNAVKKESPACLLGAQTPESDDLFPRLAGLLQTSLVTRAMDFHMDSGKKARAVRPLANGYLFEEVEFEWKDMPLVSFLPSVLFDTEPDSNKDAEVIKLVPDISTDALKTKITKIIEAAPEDLDLEEADIIVAAGRGAGKGEEFNIIRQMAKAVGGTIGATRPIIDWGTLPYEKQIGQTGKYVAPRLIINCGISGANEYTAGIEKSHQVIAIDKNPRARIFRFADLGVVGDLHEILPQVISRIEELKK